MTPLVDKFGRKHTYLRISVTDRCNLRCVYCRPDPANRTRGSAAWLQRFTLQPREAMLTFDEIERVSRLFARLGWFVYMRRGFFSASLLLPFVIGSIPAAFLGGRIQLSSTAFSLVFGSTLMLAAMRMLFLQEVQPVSHTAVTWHRQVWSMVIGVTLGFLAGMVGIGGGVFLSPVLLFLKWADVKQTAAVSSAFIALNSLSGLAGHLLRGSVPTGPMVLLAQLYGGGALPARTRGLGTSVPSAFRPSWGVVLLIAGGKLLLPLLR